MNILKIYTKFGLLKLALGLALLVYVFYSIMSSPSLNLYLYFSALFTSLYIIERYSLYLSLSLFLILKNLLITFLVQCVVVGLITLLSLILRYFLLYIFGTSFSNLDFSVYVLLTPIFIIVSLGLALLRKHYPVIKDLSSPKLYNYIYNLETIGKEKNMDDSNDYLSGSDDLKLFKSGPTVSNFWRGRHFSKYDYIQQAIEKPEWLKGKKPIKFKENLNDSKLDEFEAVHKIKLPLLIRDLFKIQNGGSLPTYFVPKEKSAKVDYDNWTGAFANDYNDIRPLANWGILSKQIEEYDQLEDYDAAKLKLIKTYDKVFVLTQRYEDHTLLDFRDDPQNPKVLIADLDMAELRVRVEFDSFEDFFNSLRAEYYPDRPSGLKKSTDPLELNQYWAWNLTANTSATSEDDWQKIETKYSVKIPLVLKKLYSYSNGGPLANGSFSFEGINYKIPKGSLLSTDKLISLFEVAEMLDFEDHRENWNLIYPNSKKMLILSIEFNSALILDYQSTSVDPKILFFKSLDKLSIAQDSNGVIEFFSINDFFNQKLNLDNLWERPFIGDRTISPLGPTSKEFWVKLDSDVLSSQDRSSPKKKDISSVEKKFKIKIPAFIKEAYEIQNGGQPLFNWMPPTILNPHGYLNLKPDSKSWTQVFKTGLRPINQWTTLKVLLTEIEDNNLTEEDKRKLRVKRMLEDESYFDEQNVIDFSSQDDTHYEDIIVLEFDFKSLKGVGLDFREYRYYFQNIGTSSSVETPDILVFRINEDKKLITDSYLTSLNLLRRKL